MYNKKPQAHSSREERKYDRELNHILALNDILFWQQIRREGGKIHLRYSRHILGYRHSYQIRYVDSAAYSCCSSIQQDGHSVRRNLPAAFSVTHAKHNVKEEKIIMKKELRRSVTDVKICGVCGGIAEYFGVDSNVVRLIWIAASLFAGSGLLLYIIAAVIMPKGNNQEDITPADVNDSNTFAEEADTNEKL